MADIALGSSALIGILMALLRRERTGQGERLDVAMTDALMSWTPHILSSVLAEGRPPDLSQERLHGGAAFYNIYRTAAGGALVLSGAEMNFVENLLTELGRPDLIALCREPWGPAQDPVKHFLAETFATRTRDEWDEGLADKGVCYAPALNLQEAWQGEQLRDRGMIVRGPDGVEQLGSPVKFGNEPGRPSETVPRLGEHTNLILARLGYDEHERQRLKQAGVC
jgi:crotonobetainyl-CoA:carnitine CoA-transferase CaiB-like acyl-CoA transferase